MLRTWRTYYNLTLRITKSRDDPGPVLLAFQQRAHDSLEIPVPMPHWKSMWPGLGRDIWEFNRRHYGLAVTHGLMHSDEL